MAYEYRPGMKMYEAVWERDGERVHSWAMHAANAADVVAEAEAFFAEHPEDDFRRDGTTVRVGIIRRADDGTFFTDFENMTDT